MLESIKLETNPVDLKIPQSPNSHQVEKSKDQNKTKKAFKIKRNKIYNSKKHLHEQFFTDPLYAGLQNEENLNENKQNIGPWVNSQKTYLNTVQYKDSNHTTQQPHSYNSYETHLRSNSINQHYSQSQILTPTNFQTAQTNSNNHLPEIKTKRELHELRFSSLALQLPKHFRLSPLKIQKNRSVQILQKQRQTGMTIDLLRYESMKYLPSSDMQFEYQNHTRPNNVIFNYCCFSNSQNDLFTKDLHEITSRNWLGKSGHLNANIKSFSLTKHQNFKQKQKTGKIMNRIDQVENTLSPLKKTISQELYAQLIKRKNKKR